MTVSARTATPITWRTARRWAYENLFSSPANTVLTILMLTLIWSVLFNPGMPGDLFNMVRNMVRHGDLPGLPSVPALLRFEWPELLGSGLLRFVLDGADWEVVTTNRRLFFVGRFPQGDLFRIWSAVYILAGMSGWSLGLWSKPGLRAAAVLAILLIPVFLFIDGGSVALLTGGAVGLFALTHVLARVVLAPTHLLDQVRTLTIVGWLAAFSVAMFVLGDVPRLLWGGLLLTLILALVGIVASFPLGMLLALGRASTFPAIRVICVGYIEVVRGVPLITLLFMAQFILPLMIEPERNLSILGLDISIFGQEVPLTGYEMDNVIRALAAITLFSAAYLAEIIRGGLQAVPKGQVEAAKALGLSTTRILALIVLPQALRAVIPTIVGQFISLFKDTSLVAVAGLTELLGVTRQVTAQQDFIGRQAEVLLFAALIYWIVAFSMSRASHQLERNLGVGER